MADLNHCILPDDLAFHVEFNVWVRDNGDGTCDIGMTDIAQTLAGALIHCRPKQPGPKAVAAGKSLATVESGKWVGPVKCPFDCTIVARNEAVEKEATVINKSPYKLGWIVRVQPAKPDALAALARGQAAVDGFRDYMTKNNLPACIHCEGFDG